MKKTSLKTWSLQASLQVRRLRSIDLLAATLCCMAVLAWTWVLPELQADLEAQQTQLTGRLAALSRLPKVPALLPPTEDERRLDAFRRMLGDRQGAEKYIATIFKAARSSGLTLAKAEYKLDFNPRTRTYVYQMLAPVVGPYASIRHFCSQVLRDVPFASLDEVGYRRDSVAAGVIEARLRFSLHLADLPVLAPAPQRQALSPSPVPTQARNVDHAALAQALPGSGSISVR